MNRRTVKRGQNMGHALSYISEQRHFGPMKDPKGKHDPIQQGVTIVKSSCNKSRCNSLKIRRTWP